MRRRQKFYKVLVLDKTVFGSKIFVCGELMDIPFTGQLGVVIIYNIYKGK